MEFARVSSYSFPSNILRLHVFDIGSNQQGLKEEMFHEVKK
jgi:hypothetical protein